MRLDVARLVETKVSLGRPAGFSVSPAAHSCKFTQPNTVSVQTDTHRYVAMHSMIEATNPQEEPVINGYLDGPLGKQGMSKIDIVIVVFGMLLPLVTQIGHAHAHAH